MKRHELANAAAAGLRELFYKEDDGAWHMATSDATLVDDSLADEYVRPIAELIERSRTEREMVAQDIGWPFPSSPRLSPDGAFFVCDQCGREWHGAKSPGCAPCAEAFAMGCHKPPSQQGEAQ